jgi:transposase-like protein
MSNFNGRRFSTDISLVYVRISYRDLEEMMAERGVVVDRATECYKAK